MELHVYQEKLYQFFLERVRHNRQDAAIAESILDDFCHLFLYSQSHNLITEEDQAIYQIIFHNHYEEFANTVKRCCYILINNWSQQRQFDLVKRLCDRLENRPTSHFGESASLYQQRRSEWLDLFVISEDYQQIKTFATEHFGCNLNKHWTEKYTLYFLADQENSNLPEQREAARRLAWQLRMKFKRDLVNFAIHSSRILPIEPPENPTQLGDELFYLIQVLLKRKGLFGYQNWANIFLKQVKNFSYKSYKEALGRYLIYSVEMPRQEEGKFWQVLLKRLSRLYVLYNDEEWDGALQLKTCCHLCDFLTSEDGVVPTDLFLTLLAQGYLFTLVILLLKIHLICPEVQMHLERRLGVLLRHYYHLEEEEGEDFRRFLEMFNVAFAIYGQDQGFRLRYNVLQWPDRPQITIFAQEESPSPTKGQRRKLPPQG